MTRSRAALAAFTVLAASGALAGCNGAVTPTAPMPGVHVANAVRNVHRYEGDALMYVSGNQNSVVAVYDMANPLEPALLRRISHGVSSPVGVSLDSGGSLYVANETGTVAIYAPGATSPALTLSQGLEQPVDVATDAAGNVYVANRGSSPGIVVYGPGQSTPSQVLTGPLIQMPVQLFLDSSDDLFYSDFVTGTAEMKAGSNQWTTLVSGSTLGIALNPLTDILYVEYPVTGPGGRHTDQIFSFGLNGPGGGRKKEHPGGGMLAFGCIGTHVQRCIWEPVFHNNDLHVYQTNKREGKLITVAGAYKVEGVAIQLAGSR